METSEDTGKYGPGQICRPINNSIAQEKSQIGKPAENACAGNPISLNSGSKYQFETDYAAAGNSGLQFSRHYNHRIETNATSMGSHWRNDYDRSIVVASSPALTSARINRPDGRTFYFVLSDGVWTGDPDVADRLTALPEGGWLYSVAEDLSVETYDVKGRLALITDAYGKRLTLSYDERGKLQTVTDRYGRQLILTYDSAGYLSEVLTPAATILRYGHDNQGRLVHVTQTDGSVRRYLYEYSNPVYLTGIVDENGDRYATWRYSAGDAVASEHGQGADRITVVYDGSAKVTDALGTTRVTRFENILGVRKTVSQSQPPGNGCPAASATIVYDAWGNSVSQTDFNGHRTVREWDTSRNLETSRTLAAGTPEQKTIRTTWHDTLRLPLAISEGNLETSFEYDAAGRLTAKNQRGADTQIRNWRYDYDTGGLLIASATPESGTYRYTYDAMGNLSTIIDEGGRMTMLSDYDADGRVGRIQGTDGVVTTLAYSPRGWLLSITRAGRGFAATAVATTLYRHDPAGQLSGLALPDGTSFEFSHDDAHRLTGIADNAGNAIVYELDAMGNRIAEKITGPDGQAVQTIRRQFDALNRLQEFDDGIGLPWRFEHNANGQLTSSTDPMARPTRYRYDALERLTGLALPKMAPAGSADAPVSQSDSITYTYGENGALASVTDPKGLVTRYGLNAFGERTNILSPDTGTTQHQIDGHGKLAAKADARNQETTITRDRLRRITELRYSSGVPTLLAYENGSDRVATIVDEAGNTNFHYDGLGYLLGKVQSHASGVRLGLSYIRYAAFGLVATARLN